MQNPPPRAQLPDTARASHATGTSNLRTAQHVSTDRAEEHRPAAKPGRHRAAEMSWCRGQPGIPAKSLTAPLKVGQPSRNCQRTLHLAQWWHGWHPAVDRAGHEEEAPEAQPVSKQAVSTAPSPQGKSRGGERSSTPCQQQHLVPSTDTYVFIESIWRQSPKLATIVLMSCFQRVDSQGHLDSLVSVE